MRSINNYKRKPERIEAIKYKGKENFYEVMDFGCGNLFTSNEGKLYLETPKQVYPVFVGDWIIRKKTGVYSIMNDKLFKEKYEKES